VVPAEIPQSTDDDTDFDQCSDLCDFGYVLVPRVPVTEPKRGSAPDI